MKKVTYWFMAFLVLFSMLSFGVFILLLGRGDNILTALGSALIVASITFAASFLIYGLVITDDDS